MELPRNTQCALSQATHPHSELELCLLLAPLIQPGHGMGGSSAPQMEHTHTHTHKAKQTKQTPNQGTEAEATPGATCAEAGLQIDGEMDKTLRRFLTHE